jgi:hypothetical protein
MELFKNKRWSWCDIAFLKGSAIMFGMIVGAYLSGFIREHLVLFILGAVVLAIRPAIAYFRAD